ncbi:porin [Pseudomonas sp. TCU-HL1]|uniref:porin n=1 Tax=Pseudomonas sp. TCU-HL1 TaxID=1856685 RepID=UPI00083CD2CA|nr:porin [Pseudomonas sp. TCU-HL1]AOE83030.1 hypothetical protein THL1_482 [Pseudomonas sp. TCU-HL1]
MRKLLLALPLVSGYACASIEISGVLDVNYEVATSGGMTEERVTGGGLSTNRVQFKWQEEVTEDLSLKTVYEAQYNPHSDDDIGKREVYAQVISKRWGTLSTGRQDTPSANAYGYADPLYNNDYSLISNMGVFYAPWRVDRSLMYISPRINGFEFRGMATQGENDGSRDGRVYSVAVDRWTDSPWYFSAALDRQYQRNLWDKHTMEQSTDAYLTAVYTMGRTDLSAVYHRYVGYYAYAPWVDFESNGSDLQLGLRHNFGNKHNVAVSLMYKDDRKDEALSDATGLNLGYIYNYDKNTDLYGVYGYVHHNRDSEIRYPISWNLENPLPDENPQGLQLGVRIKF